jgi:hypothetical protein
MCAKRSSFIWFLDICIVYLLHRLLKWIKLISLMNDNQKSESFYPEGRIGRFTSNESSKIQWAELLAY